jgi:hypothetical protein
MWFTLRSSGPSLVSLSLALCLLTWSTESYAQEAVVGAGSASAEAGGTVDILVSFTPGETPVSSLRFEITWPEELAYGSTATGAAASEAGKSATGAAIENGVRVLVFGLNTTAIGAGSLATITLQIDVGARAGSLPIQTRVIDASTPDAQMVSATASDGSVTVIATGPSCGNGVVEAGETCDPPSSCPSSCSDGDGCTLDTLTGSADNCSASCSHAPISECRAGDGCCPAGCDANSDSDCSASCGNGVVEAGETCDPPSSCPSSCSDGDGCTLDTLTGSADNCSASCSHAPISECRAGDGCCPAGCDANSDSDCSASCGNGVVEAGETCDPPSSCPSSCSDGDGCTLDTLTGSADNCSASCSHAPISECRAGDGCCPAGCDASTDDDCAPAPSCADTDGDGFGDPVTGCADDRVDCDDTNAAINPSASEVCNGLDDNCDGNVDEGFDLDTDPENCGVCGNGCNGQACAAGTCLPPPAKGLVLEPPDPGFVGAKSVIRVRGATPGSLVQLAYGLRMGSTKVWRCSDTKYEIKSPWFLRRHGRANDAGEASFRVWVHRRAAGLKVFLQAADLKACELSNVVQHTFAAKSSDFGASAFPARVTGLAVEGGLPLLEQLDGQSETLEGGGCSLAPRPEAVSWIGGVSLLLLVLVRRRRRFAWVRRGGTRVRSQGQE